MKVAVVREAGSPFVIEEREVPEPGPGRVRVKVHACGVCHSDQFVRDALWPDLALPRVPGHEVAGVVDAVGDGVDRIERGDRVGVGWYGGHCGTCDPCREGDFVLCENGLVTGITHDGGYGEYLVAPAESLAAIPDGMPMTEAAPLLCAGVTVYNSLRNAGARPDDLVAVQGMGGLGHLGVQFASAAGFRVAALSRGKDKRDLAEQLGADEYIDTADVEPAAALQQMGGARVILATAPSGKATSPLVPGLGRNGTLVVLGVADEPIEVTSLDLITGRRSVMGWPSGSARDSEDTLRFAAAHGVKPMIETFPLDRANDAYDRMIRNQARFRSVLELH